MAQPAIAHPAAAATAPAVLDHRALPLPPEASVGRLPEQLQQIRRVQIRLAVWQRSLRPELSRWLAATVRRDAAPVQAAFDPQRPAPEAVGGLLLRSLEPAGVQASLFAHWHRDVLDLLQVARQIAPQSAVLRLRLQRLEDAGRPLFHVDGVPLRMLCAYVGAGAQWLPETALDRCRLGAGTNASVRDWSQVRTLASGEVAVLKGERYPGNAGRGLVHRSPPASAQSPRVVLAIDFG